MYQEIINIRQSLPWQTFMDSLGWTPCMLKNGACVYVFRSPFGLMNIAKMQKARLLDEKDIDEIDSICKKKKVLFIKLEPNIGQREDLLDKGKYVKTKYPLSPSITSTINLKKSKEDLWNALSKSGKYGVNRARREGFRVEFYDDPSNEILKKAYDVHISTSKRNHFVSRSLSELCKRRDAFKERMHVGMVFDGAGTICGIKILQGHGEMVLYTYGGTSEEGIHNRAGYLLMWESIMYLKDKGYDLFDLEGMYDPRFPKDFKGWEGFTEFKKKFGVTIIEFPEPRTKFFNPIFELFVKFTKLSI